MSANQEIQNSSVETSANAGDILETNGNSSETPGESKPNENQTEILSRRKQKKLLKLAKWEETKQFKRQKEREKQKLKRAKEKELGIIGQSSKRKRLKLNKMENSPNLVSVAIDFDYDDLMDDKDIAKCAKQMMWVYTVNRKSPMPIKLHFTSIREESRIVKALGRNQGYTNWDVKIHQQNYLDLFDRSSIVYLTSDSDNVLHELDPNAVYIIGGLVDHNHHKGLSLERSKKNSLKTARLPLSEHIEMKTRSVLTIVHVFEILLKVSEGKPWKETLLEVLPERKFRVGNKRHNKHKQNDSSQNSDDESSHENEDEHETTQTNDNETESKHQETTDETSLS